MYNCCYSCIFIFFYISTNTTFTMTTTTITKNNNSINFCCYYYYFCYYSPQVCDYLLNVEELLSDGYDADVVAEVAREKKGLSLPQVF